MFSVSIRRAIGAADTNNVVQKAGDLCVMIYRIRHMTVNKCGFLNNGRKQASCMCTDSILI